MADDQNLQNDDLVVSGVSGKDSGIQPAGNTAQGAGAQASQATGSQAGAGAQDDGGAVSAGVAGNTNGMGLGFGFDDMEEQGSAVKAKVQVPALVTEKFPDLIDLINVTESMNQEEREYWLQILPVMTEDQIAKFREILLTEKKQLSELDTEYEEELTRLNEKHMIEWQEFESKEKRKALQSAESKSEEEEAAMEEELLSKLAEI